MPTHTLKRSSALGISSGYLATYGCLSIAFRRIGDMGKSSGNRSRGTPGMGVGPRGLNVGFRDMVLTSFTTRSSHDCWHFPAHLSQPRVLVCGARNYAHAWYTNHDKSGCKKVGYPKATQKVDIQRQYTKALYKGKKSGYVQNYIMKFNNSIKTVNMFSSTLA